VPRYAPWSTPQKKIATIFYLLLLASQIYIAAYVLILLYISMHYCILLHITLYYYFTFFMRRDMRRQPGKPSFTKQPPVLKSGMRRLCAGLCAEQAPPAGQTSYAPSGPPRFENKTKETLRKTQVLATRALRQPY